MDDIALPDGGDDDDARRTLKAILMTEPAAQ